MPILVGDRKVAVCEPCLRRVRRVSSDPLTRDGALAIFRTLLAHVPQLTTARGRFFIPRHCQACGRLTRAYTRELYAHWGW